MLPSIPLAICLLIPGVHSFPLNAPSDSDNQADAPSRRDTTTLIEAVVVTSTIIAGGTSTSTSSAADRTSAASEEAQIYFLPPDAAFAPTPGSNSSVPLAAIQKSDSGDSGGDPYPQDPSSDADPDPNAKDGDGDSTAPDPDPNVAPTPNTGGGDPPPPHPGILPDPNGLPTQATKPLQGPLVMGYYPDWVADAFPPEKIDFSRFDWIDFAFAVPTEKFELTFDGSADGGGLLRRLVAAAHKKGKKVKLSVGGWTGSKYFSLACANDKNRQTFANSILASYKQYNLDGIDIDWEYPGQSGAKGNNVSPNDAADFLAFLKLLRATLPPAARISAAAQTQPFADAHGNPLKNVAPFANVLDWVLMMNYDIWGSSSNPGPNAPLSDACHNSTQPAASADAAVKAWTEAGFPVNKLVLGLPSYGYVSGSIATHLRTEPLQALAEAADHDPSADPPPPPPEGHAGPIVSDSPTNTTTTQDDPPDDGSGTFMNGTIPQDTTDPGIYPNITTPDDPARPGKHVLNDDGAPADGQVQFRALVAQGVLCGVRGAPGSFRGCGGFARYWDACSNTPWLRSGSAGQVIAYDDGQSLGLKASYARQRGILGVNLFDVHGDTDEWVLVDAARKGLGILR